MIYYWIGLSSGIALVYATDWVCWKSSQMRLRRWASLDDEVSKAADEKRDAVRRKPDE